jgi:hypothetical protein
VIDTDVADATPVVVDSPYCGMPGVGHGGFTAGLAAERLPGQLVEARFLRPPPSATPMRLRAAQQGLELLDGDNVVLQLHPVTLALEVPEPPTMRQAEYAAMANLEISARPSPTCITCGNERAPGDGLRVFVHPIDAREIVAGAWTPHENFGDASGHLAERFIWAALDCPTFWAIDAAYDVDVPLVTARLAVSILQRVPVDQPLIVMAWPIAERSNRLWVSGAAIVTPEGRPLAVARATWIANRTSG